MHSWDTSSPPNATTAAVLFLGRGGANDFIGDIDEVLIQAEVLSDFSNGINALVIPEPGSGLLLLGAIAALGSRAPSR